MKTRTAALCGLLFVACSVHAASPASPDAAIGKKLDKQELKYEIDSDGDYKLLFEVEGERSQIVWVRSTVETLGAMRIRELLSVAGKMSKPKTADEITVQAVLTAGAMMKSSSQKLGGWVLKTSGDDSVFYYVAQVPADISGEDLEVATRAVARSADEFEVLFETMTSKAKKDEY